MSTNHEFEGSELDDSIAVVFLPGLARLSCQFHSSCKRDPYIHGVSVPPACYAPSINGFPYIKMVSLRAFVMLDRRAEVGKDKYKSFSKLGQIEFISLGLLEVRHDSSV